MNAATTTKKAKTIEFDGEQIEIERLLTDSENIRPRKGDKLLITDSPWNATIVAYVEKVTPNYIEATDMDGTIELYKLSGCCYAVKHLGNEEDPAYGALYVLSDRKPRKG